MSPRETALRIMAVAAGLLMLTVAADQTVANLGLLDSTVSTESANGNNNTTPPTPPPEPLLPPDEPQRPVDPGTVTEGWDSSTLAPSNVSLLQDVVARNSENGTEYDTAYGNFLLNNSSRSFVEVISPGPNPQKIGESVFLVLYEGLLLSPGNEIADDTNASELSVSYSLYSSALLMGNMTVDYLFYSDRNKITISFSPSVGSPDQYQIVWLTFTNWDVVDTAFPDDIDQRFEDLRGYYGTILDTLYNIGTVAIPGAIIRQERVPGAGLGGPSVRMDASDAATDFAASYAGHLSFGDHSGNAVLTTFQSGHLTIDPQFIVYGVPSTSTAYSVQRKTFYDGSRYWLFYASQTNTAVYINSVDGKNWGIPQVAFNTPGGTISYGFTVINYDKTVGVLWTDSTDAISIHIRTGLITEDVIQWDDSSTTGRTLYSWAGRTINSPVSAAFTSRGLEFGATWTDNQGSSAFQRYQCTGRGPSGFSACATNNVEAFGGSTAPDFWTGTASALSPVGDSSLLRARIDDSTHYAYVKVYGAGQVICEDVSLVVGSPLPAEGGGWWSSGLFAVQPSSGARAYIFVFDGHRIDFQGVDIGCTADARWRGSVYPDSSTVAYFSAATDENGIIHLFYVDSGNVRYSRVIIGVSNPPSIVAFSPSAPYHITASLFASHFIPVAFYALSALYYANYPLPLDGEAAVTNPWATKLGAPFVSDVGGIVSPTTGLLASGQILVGSAPSIAINYREPGLFKSDGTKFGPPGYGPYFERYQIIPGVYYDLPWLSFGGCCAAFGELHMPGGLKYAPTLTGSTLDGNSFWYNITKGTRYTLLHSYLPTETWTLTSPSGSYMVFETGTGNISKAYLDVTGTNSLNYITNPGTCDANGCHFSGSIADSSTPSRSLSFSDTGIAYYGNGQSIAFAKTLGGWSAQGTLPACSGASSDSGELQITDAVGRVTTYWVCKWKLVGLDSNTGGRVLYTYASNPVSQGTEAYSYPVTSIDIYNESAAGVKARSRVFNWVFQNGEVVRALVNTTDKGAIVQGSNEYVFNAAMGTASVRTYDSSGQALYYDMETLNGANMKDLSGNANDGVVSGSGGTFVTGRYGKARGLSGAAWLDAGNGPTVQFLAGSFTISAIIQTTSAATDNEIVAKGGSCAVGGYKLTTQSGKLRGTFNNQGANPYYQALSLRTINDGAWHSVVFVVDRLIPSASVGYLYIDGTLDTTGTVTDTSAWNIASSSDLGIGYSNSVGGSCPTFFNGNIDEVRIFGRALSAEEVGTLYSKNALEKGEQQNWYSVNDMPHLTEGFAADETTASAVSSDAIDDWGNQIYGRDATGNETFSSYANTNHQNHFYAPGRLAKNSATTFSTEFIDFGSGQFPSGPGSWTVTSAASPAVQLNYSSFVKATPSLQINMPNSDYTTVEHFVPSSVAYPRFLEFSARVSAASKNFEITFRKTGGVIQLGANFTTANTIKVYNGGTGMWVDCAYPSGGSSVPYVPNAWYRFTFELNREGTNIPWKAYLNGIDLSCGSLTVLDGSPLYEVKFYGVKYAAAWSALVDNIKIYANNCKVGSDTHCSGYSALDIGFDGLQARQSLALVAENGTVIDQAMETGSNTLWLSFNSGLTGSYGYYENGDAAKTTVKVYAEDGTLEYQSPLTRFFGGERYTYARPRAFADEVVKTTSGALYWPNTVYADDSCNPGITCTGNGAWIWRQSLSMRGSFVHTTPFGFGARFHYFQLNTTQSTPSFFTTYVRIPNGKTPDGIALAASSPVGSWAEASWGVPPDISAGSILNMGPVPTARDQWIQLTVKSTELTALGNQWGWFGFAVTGGEVDWDVTSTLTGASLSLNGLTAIASSGLNVDISYASNGTVIATGSQSGDSVSISLYNRLRGITSFPVSATVKIYDNSNTYYQGPARNIWPGDIFRYKGASGFFDPKSSNAAYWPSSTVHTTQLGFKRFAADCLDAVLCYDMETMTEGRAVPDTGVVDVLMVDLSGSNNVGYEFGTGCYPCLSDPVSSAAGLGSLFKPFDTSVIYALDSSSLKFGTGDFTLSTWFRASALPATGAYYEILGKRVNNNGDYEIRLTNSGGTTRIVATVGDSTGSVSVTSNASISANMLYHVAFRRASSTISLWLNGAIAASTAVGSKNTDSTSKLEIARDPWTIVNFFNGSIDQVIVYKRALTASQLLALYQARIPGGPQVYLQPTDYPSGSGLIRAKRSAFEGTYLYSLQWYDSRGNVIEASDEGRSSSSGGPLANHTLYEYSTVYGQDYLTKVTRPYVSGDSGSAGRPVYYAYDFAIGARLGTLDVDCRRMRTSYDAVVRPLEHDAFDTDSSEVLHLDMDTVTSNGLKDVSCAATADSRNGQGTGMGGTGTLNTIGIDGSARDFRGPGWSDYLRVSNAPSLNPTSFTISFWINPDTFPTSYVRVLSKNTFNSPAGTYQGWSVLYNGQSPYGRIYLAVWNSANVEFDSQLVQLVTGQWQHVAFTFDGINLKSYLNGILLPCSCSLSGTFATSPNDLIVGAGDSNSITTYFDGKIDDLRLFNVVRSAQEVIDIFRFNYKLLSRTSASYDDMAGFAEFAGYPGTSMTIYDEVSTRRSLFFDMQTKKATIAGTDYIEDVSGNGNTGKLGSGVTLGAAGKVGLAATFPGSASGYVSASSRFVFATSAFTVAFWAYPTALPGSSTYFFGSTQAGGGDVIYGSQTNGVLSCTLVNTLGGSYSTPSGALSLNNWNHVACTFDGSKLRLYLNGIEQGSGTSFVGAPRRPQADFRVGGYAGLTGVTGILDEFQVVLRGMNAQEISGLYGGAIGASPGTITAFPSSNTGTCSGADNGDWVNPTNAYSDNGIYASAIAANGQTKCNTWTGFGINVPSWAIITSVTVQSDSFETSTEGQLTVHLGSGPCNDVIGGNVTSDFTSCQAWKPSDFASIGIEVSGFKEPGFDSSCSFYLDYVSITVSYVAPPVDPTHVMRTYVDGLGRQTRQGAFDTYGKSIQTVKTLGWNDRPIYAFRPSGGYFTYAYDFLGRTLVATTPGGSLAGTSHAVVGEKARLVETIDPLGRKAYSKSDLIGRTMETAVWNPATGAYGNLTSTTFNALSKAVVSKDAKGQVTAVYYNLLGKPKITLFWDGTYSVASYDDNLREFQTVDAMGRVAVQAYDILGRITSVTLKPSLAASCTGTPNPCVVSYGYDPIHDDLLTVDNATAKITYTYDGLHRIKTERLDVPSASPIFTGTLTYIFDNASKVADIQYPAGLASLHAVYTYDSLARPSEVDYGGSKYAVLTYDSAGRLDNIHYWKGATDTTITEKYIYDARDRVTQLKVSDGGSTVFMQQDYVYNKASEITGVTDNMYVSDAGVNGVSNPKTITYEYNGNGRLQKAVGPFGASQASSTLKWTYDQVGNLQTAAVDASTYTYTVTGWNRLDSLSLNGMSFTYNAAGSLLTKVEGGSTTTYTHDFQQQLTKTLAGSNTYTYSYDGLGRRVTNVTNVGPTSYFLYAGDRMLYSKVGTTETAYVYVGSHLLLKKDGTGATPEARYYHQDIAPGNVRFVSYYTTSVVQTEAKLRYKPFGDQILLAGAGGRFEYAHQELDAAVRLYHMGARYYDPVVGRFIERDPIGPGYDYADNNPISFYDPTGLDAWSDLGGWFAGIGHAAVDWAKDWATGVQNAGNAIAGASTAAVSSVASAGQGVSNWWNNLDPNVRGAIILAVVVVAIVATGGIAAVPLAGTAIGSILMTAAVGAAIGAVTDAALYTGITVATGGEWSFEGMAQQAAIGAFVGGVTAGAGKAFSIWRAGELVAETGGVAYDGAQSSSRAYQIAEQGGKHAGFLRNMAGKSASELTRARSSLLRVAEEHLDKIRSPASYIDNWAGYSARAQRGILSHWAREAQTFLEQADIIQDLLSQGRAL